MAQHIQTIASSSIPKGSKADFYAAIQFGDIIFCQGNYDISKAIQVATRSCLSHVLVSWLPPNADCWLTAESTADKGVHVGLISDYVDKYNGDIVICRATGLTDVDHYKMMNQFYSVLECAYNATEEVSTLMHKLTMVLPIVQPKKEYYCSQLVKFMRQPTVAPCGVGIDGVNYTPEDAWLDSAIYPVLAYCK